LGTLSPRQLDREGIETNGTAKLRKIVESAHLDRILPGVR
jgi:hypothetical protein